MKFRRQIELWEEIQTQYFTIDSVTLDELLEIHSIEDFLDHKLDEQVFVSEKFSDDCRREFEINLRTTTTFLLTSLQDSKAKRNKLRNGCNFHFFDGENWQKFYNTFYLHFVFNSICCVSHR